MRVYTERCKDIPYISEYKIIKDNNLSNRGIGVSCHVDTLNAGILTADRNRWRTLSDFE